MTPVLPMLAVDAACAALGASDDGQPVQPSFIHDGVLHIAVPSTGSAMLFAAALTAELIQQEMPLNDIARLTGARRNAAVALALEVMIHASDAPQLPFTPGYMVICFPGVTVDPGDPEIRRRAAQKRLSAG